MRPHDFVYSGVTFSLFVWEDSFALHSYEAGILGDDSNDFRREIAYARGLLKKRSWCVYLGHRINPVACFWKRDEAIEQAITELLVFDAERRLGG